MAKKRMYAVLSVKELNVLIQRAKDTRSEENFKSGVATVVIDFEESVNEEGQLSAVFTDEECIYMYSEVEE